MNGKLLVICLVVSFFLASPGFADPAKKHPQQSLCISAPGTCYFESKRVCSGCLGETACEVAAPPYQRVARAVLPSGFANWMYGSEIRGRCELPNLPNKPLSGNPETVVFR